MDQRVVYVQAMYNLRAKDNGQPTGPRATKAERTPNLFKCFGESPVRQGCSLTPSTSSSSLPSSSSSSSSSSK